MKTLRTTTGPFAERTYFRTDEIEHLCADELRAAGLYPSDPQPIRIERFIEKRFRISPTYVDLPDRILGVTKFGRNGVQEILVSRALVDEDTPSSQRRVNTTLAHEAGHGLLHTHLFLLEAASPPLFGGATADDPKVLCRTDAIPAPAAVKPRGYDGRWWEFQANRAIGPLLLPKPLVLKCLASRLTQRGSFLQKVLDEEARRDASRALADIFDVNPIVARIRIDELWPDNQEVQMML